MKQDVEYLRTTLRVVVCRIQCREQNKAVFEAVLVGGASPVELEISLSRALFWTTPRLNVQFLVDESLYGDGTKDRRDEAEVVVCTGE